MFVVAAEFMGASEGLGYLLVDGQQMGKPDQILAAIIAFALLGKAADSLLVATKPAACAGRTRRGTACDRADADPRAPVQDLCRRHAGPRRRHPRVEETEIVALLGGSGCGKTTLLRLPPGSTGPSAGADPPRRRDDRGAASGDRHRLPGAAAAALAHRRRQCRLRAGGRFPAPSADAASPRPRRGRPVGARRRAGRATSPAASSSASRSRAPS